LLEQEQEQQNSRLDALEAQPPPSAGIRVFADNGDFLGILVNIALDQNTRVTTYIPSLGKFLELRNTNDIASARTRLILHYDELDCNGTVYIMPRECDICESHPNFLFANENSFYEQIGDASPEESQSKRWPDGTCENVGDGETGPFDPLAPVQVFPVDFTYPIATPISLE
jgi:hypothetical protein